jgi:hypothetical protein
VAIATQFCGVYGSKNISPQTASQSVFDRARLESQQIELGRN